jgi:hypothetical protein
MGGDLMNPGRRRAVLAAGFQQGARAAPAV